MNHPLVRLAPLALVFALASPLTAAEPTPAPAPSATFPASPPTTPPPTAADTSVTPERIAALRAELEAMHETDQAQRQQMTVVEREQGPTSPQLAELWKKQNASDRYNIGRLEAIIAEIGWPKRSLVGNRAASAAFLILQHADLAYQKKYLALARAAVAEKEMSGSSLALLEDRVRLREGGKQIYGSQVHRNDAGEWEPLPLEDPAGVDARRTSVGLGPLADYLAGFAQRSGGKVADNTRNQPATEAPAPTQTLFATTDDARAAYEKLRAVRLESGPAALTFQLACHEFCTRFPASTYYGAVRILGARARSRLRPPELRAPEVWDPADAALDPKLNAEQRAEIAVIVAWARVTQTVEPRSETWEEAVFSATVDALRPYLATRYAKDSLGRAALDQPPERAIPLLRELYPDDPDTAAAIRALEQIGRPVELRFTALDGRTIDLRDYRGKVVLLACWAGGNSFSNQHLTRLKEITARHPAADLAVIGVSFDRTREAAQSVVTEQKWTWPVYCDGLGWNNALAERFRLKILPNHLLIDRQGVLRFRSSQLTSATERQLATLIAEPAPPAAAP